MDFRRPADDDPRRIAVRAWLDEHPDPDGRALAEAGYVCPHWPAPWGIGADPEHQLIVAEELRAAGVVLPENQIGTGWAGPTILAGGTAAQQQRWLPGLLDGTEFWCQLFSEPEAGSDLAGLRTRAVRDGDHYVVNGQKIWSTWADRSDWGILLARTDPSAPKHKGISYFALDMRTPGIEVRPITEMTGQSHFNETFLTDVRIPVDCRIGAEGDGWRLANVTLGNERVSLSEGGVLWGMGPESPELFDLVRAEGGVADPALRQEAAAVYTEMVVLRLLGDRMLSALLQGREPGPEASIRKTMADAHGQRVMALAKARRGADGMLGVQGPDAEHVDVWHWGYLFSRALTIGGGTSEVQRNIIGERLLGLPPGAGVNPDEFSCLRFERHERMLVVTIDRPGDDLNRVDATLHHELTALFAGLKRERDARAVVLGAEGRAFSAGGDFEWFPALQEPGALGALHLDAKALIWDLLDVPVPLVCALDGPAVGLGASIALLCDAVFMASSATLVDPHVRVGIVAGDGGTVAWPLAVGPMLAKRYLLTGDPLGAADAARLGLVTEAVPDGQALPAAVAFAERLAAGAPLAVQGTKQAVNALVKDALARSFDLATALEIGTFASADHAEALRALADKRSPDFTGT